MDGLDLASGRWVADLRGRIEEVLDTYRTSLYHCLDGLSEEEARRKLVPSNTTLLGLLNHVTYVEGVWFDQAITGRSPKEIGLANSPATSFQLRASDNIASVQQAHQHRCEQSRQFLAELGLDVVVSGRGQHAIWSLLLQVLRELAQHAGHADILREQILATRNDR
jgi:uncharacterized damage-inducible protein DinB